MHKFRELRHFECIKHNRGVRKLKALIGIPQIGVSINVQNSEVGVTIADRPNRPQRNTVIATNHRYLLALIHRGLSLVKQPLIYGLTLLINLVQHLH